MPGMLRAAVLAMALAPLSACGADEAQHFMQTFSGDPFMGRVGVGIRPPYGSGHEGRRDSGLGTLQVQTTDDHSARLIVVGNIRAPGDAGFVVDGTYDENGWRSTQGDVEIRIAPDGTISGGGVSHPTRFRFGGNITGDEVLLEVDLELLEASEGGFPAGTHFNFYYVLQRARADAQGDDGDCERIEYRLQSVPNPFGGSMGMVRVPECIR